VLLEFGTRPWNEQYTIADYIFQSPINFNLIHNETIRQILAEYKRLYDDSRPPDEKYFLYHADPQISQLSVNVLYTHYEISENWQKNYHIEVPDRDGLFREDADSVVNFVLQKMIMRLMKDNLEMLREATDPSEEAKLMKIHHQLIEEKKAVFSRSGTVIRR
jgi:DNA primase